jgi:hypothetical protein
MIELSTVITPAARHLDELIQLAYDVEHHSSFSVLSCCRQARGQTCCNSDATVAAITVRRAASTWPSKASCARSLCSRQPSNPRSQAATLMQWSYHPPRRSFNFCLYGGVISDGMPGTRAPAHVRVVIGNRLICINRSVSGAKSRARARPWYVPDTRHSAR